VLDIGAEIDPTGDRSLQLIDTYPYKKSITALNINNNHIDTIRKIYPSVNAITGDACKLPWPDKHFDVVYSNAVIEHVGDIDKQKQMALEVMRVSKNWFVTTPNRWYPFEFHLRLPLVTWLPFHGYLLAGQLITYNHVRRKYMTFTSRIKSLRLMTAREIRNCFANSRIIMQRVTFWPETIIVVGGDILHQTPITEHVDSRNLN
ncbi:class I SAM-dependent methyltransferase, partial [Planctomycetota bacterium]